MSDGRADNLHPFAAIDDHISVAEAETFEPCFKVFDAQTIGMAMVARDFIALRKGIR